MFKPSGADEHPKPSVNSNFEQYRGDPTSGPSPLSEVGG